MFLLGHDCLNERSRGASSRDVSPSPKERNAFWVLVAGPATSPGGEACVE